MNRLYQIIIVSLLLIIAAMAAPSVAADDDSTWDISARVEFNDAELVDGEWHSNDCIIYRMEIEPND